VRHQSLCLLLSGLALVVHGRAHAEPPAPPAGVVFVANGSGGLHTATTGLKQALTEACCPLQVETVAWTYAKCMFLLDHMNRHNHHAMGRDLAAQVSAHRQKCPGARVYLLGHSTGCAVVLAAAGCLPPGSVDRIILLSPSVSPGYDLRPALACACEGIDVFISHRDHFFLGFGMSVIGTADGRLCSAAGRSGFKVPDCPGADAELYSRLRQYPWDDTCRGMGHTGGHYGNNRAAFLRAYVVPLLCPDAGSITAPAPAVLTAP
jgi:pimeloyl-ACP methyl ester carboxylesterase